jgi:hypothetical protein
VDHHERERVGLPQERVEVLITARGGSGEVDLGSIRQLACMVADRDHAEGEPMLVVDVGAHPDHRPRGGRRAHRQPRPRVDGGADDQDEGPDAGRQSPWPPTRRSSAHAVPDHV